MIIFEPQYDLPFIVAACVATTCYDSVCAETEKQHEIAVISSSLRLSSFDNVVDAQQSLLKSYMLSPFSKHGYRHGKGGVLVLTSDGEEIALTICYLTTVYLIIDPNIFEEHRTIQHSKELLLAEESTRSISAIAKFTFFFS